MKIHKRIKIKWILIGVLVMLFALPLTASAQSVSGQLSSVFSEVLSGFAQFLTVLLKVLQRILWPVFLAIGGLLNNDILFGYGMEQRLLEVWVQIRNIVNVLFVIALLGVALFNVLAFKPDSEFALKTFLPKFAIALIAVNFSYIGMKIILDVSNVATYAVFALPSSISTGIATPEFLSCPETGPCGINGKEGEATVSKICTAYYGTINEGWKELDTEIGKITDQKAKDNMRNSLLCAVEGSKYTLSASGYEFFKRYNSKNVALIMAIQFMNVTKIDDVASKFNIKDSTTKDVKIDSLAFNLLFAVILYIVYGAAYLAIFVVLLVRVVVLWLFIALSPLVVLKFVVPQGVIPESGDITGKFLKNTFAPVLMAIPLTIGYIILEAFKGMNYVSGKPVDTVLKFVRIDNAAISDLQSMIIAFAAVAVVWVGVFAAAEGTFAQIATDYIKGVVKGIGSKAAQALTFIPVIPAGQGGKGLSLAQAQGVWNRPWENLKAKYGRGTDKQNISVDEIRRITKKGTVEEAKRAISSGVETKQGQREVYNLLETWRKKGTYPQKQFATKAIEKLKGQVEYGNLKTGKLTEAEKRRVKNISFLTPSASVDTGSRRTPGVKPGTKPVATPAGGAGTGVVSQDVRSIRQAEGLGIVSAGLVQKRKEHEGASSLGEKEKVQKRKTIESDLSNNDEMKNVKKALGASQELGAVQSRVGTLKPDSKGDAVATLTKELKTADAALKKRGIKEDGRKQLLGNILKNKFGADAKKFTDANADVGKYVSL